MPRKFRKGATEEELLGDDSDDENYVEETKQRKRTASGNKKSSKSKRRTKQPVLDSEEDEDISEDLSDNQVPSEEEEEYLEYNANGRPVRRTAKTNPKNYKDEDSESIEDSEEDEVNTPPRKKVARGARPASPPPKRQIITLKVRTPAPPTTRRELPPRTARGTSRGVSAQRTVGGKGPMKTAGKAPRATRGRGVSETSTGSAIGTRRSSRLGHDEEPMMALTNSGKHAEILGAPWTHPEIKEEGESAFATSKEDSAIADELDVDAHHEQDDIDDIIEPAPQEEQPPTSKTGPEEVGPEEADDEDDDVPVRRTRRVKATQGEVPESPSVASRDLATKGSAEKAQTGRRIKSLKRTSSRSKQRRSQSDDEEFQLEDNASSDEGMSSEGTSPSKRREQVVIEEVDSDQNSRLRNRGKRPISIGRKRGHSSSDEAETQAELQDELEDLRPSPKRRNLRRQEKLEVPESMRGMDSSQRLRARKEQPDYRISRPEIAAILEGDLDGGITASKKSSRQQAKSLFDTHGIFGGDMGLVGPGAGATMDIDSDSSADEITATSGPGAARGSVVGMTPTTARAPGWLPPMAQTHNVDPLQTAPANLGKVTKASKQGLADTDPVGVSGGLTFDSIGGMDDKIQQLKEMVMLPLMYEDVFKAKNTTPPRGVLFHGPPGTGKTLLARILAAACSTDNRKVTFYMRKGADVLSKWVGEAERQLRLLFEEAKNNQPSIIFFDEIDGLAPVRSSKQDQIHSSIVSTLLALMDGMDGRGQVVVIGATNRPDALDPALRRPGRFDREFYFPLPDTTARRRIIDIHTTKWDPPLANSFKDHLADVTRGYGGADLRALCTEAALVAIQRTYPQIYKSVDKLKIDPTSIKVAARDFMMSIKKMVPSSERSTASPATPLPAHIVPLLSQKLKNITTRLEHIMPQRKRLTALEEAEYEDDYGDAQGFEREKMMEAFDNSRVFRPRLLIHGHEGMGQQYLGPAVLHSMEKVFIQSFDLATLMSDSTRSPEAAVVQLFVEVKRHKPSVIYIPNIDVWYENLSKEALAAFKGLVRSIAPNDAILLLATMDGPIEANSAQFLKDFFSHSHNDRFAVERPDSEARHAFFADIIETIQKSPDEFPPNPEDRRKRILPELARASPEPEKLPTKEQLKAQEMSDKQQILRLKSVLHPLVMAVKEKYGKRRKPAVDYDVIRKVLNPPPAPQSDVVTSDLIGSPAQRYDIKLNEDGALETVTDRETGKWFYNLDIDTVEDRWMHGYYLTPDHFLEDVRRLRHDAFALNDQALKRIANEVHTHVELVIMEWDRNFSEACAAVARRQKQREEEQRAKAKKKAEEKKGSNSGSAAARQSGRNSHRNSPENPIVIPSSPRGPGDVRHSNGNKATGEPTNVLLGPIHIPGGPQGSEQLMSPPSQRVQGTHTAFPDSAERENITLDRDAYQSPVRPIMEPRPAEHTQIDFSQSSQNSHSNHSSSNHSTANYQTPKLAHSLAQSTQATASGMGGDIAVTRVSMGISYLVNDASSTTSGKRTSDATTATGGYNSQPWSNPYSNSNGTNSDRPSGYSENFIHPPFQSFAHAMPGDSQLPDTQIIPSTQDSAPPPQSVPASQMLGTQTSPDARHSQAFPLPGPPERHRMLCDLKIMADLHNKLATRTSGYSIEQLEQINSAMMDRVWRNRMLPDRNTVADVASEEFEKIDKDIRELQDVGLDSQSFDY